MRDNEHWTQQGERTSRFWLKLIMGLALRFPRAWVRVLLHAIVLFYWLGSPRQRWASRHYLAQVLQRKPTWRDTYRHFYHFAATLLDRVYFLTNRVELFDLTIENLPQLRDSLATHPAQLFFGAHFGSLDAVRALSVNYFPTPLKAVVKMDQNQSIVGLLNELSPDLSAMLIPYNGMQTVFDIHEALMQQTSVAMLKDRRVADEACVTVRFFDDRIAVPMSGFKLAKRLGIPISVFFGRYEGANRYVMVSELLPIDKHMTIQDMAQLYMDKVAEQCRLTPYNWFNFYPYWLKEDDVARGEA